jgi:hypothetical protein
MVITFHDRPGAISQTISARECDLRIAADSLLLHVRSGSRLSADGSGALYDEGMIKLPWRPAAK